MRYGATVGNGGMVLELGGTSANLEVLMRMGAIEPLDGDRPSSLVLNVTWTCTWTRSNRVEMVEVNVCW